MGARVDQGHKRYDKFGYGCYINKANIADEIKESNNRIKAINHPPGDIMPKGVDVYAFYFPVYYEITEEFAGKFPHDVPTNWKSCQFIMLFDVRAYTEEDENGTEIIYVDPESYRNAIGILKIKQEILGGLNILVDFPDLQTGRNEFQLGKKVIDREEDFRIPTLGIDPNHCYVVMCKNRPSNKVFFSTEPNFERSDARRRYVKLLNYYLNSYMTMWPEEVFNCMKIHLLKLQRDGIINVYMATREDLEKYTNGEKYPKNRDILQAGFLGIAAVSKKSSASFAPKNDELGNVAKWIQARIDALFTSCGYPAPKGNFLDITRDVLLMVKYLDDSQEARKELSRPIWDIKVSGTTKTTIWPQFLKYTQSILEYAGLSTVTLAYNFAKTPTTAAIALRDVVDQSETLEKHYEELKRDKLFPYIYFRKPIPKELEISSFPDLAYCAIYKKKTLQLDSSWDNYTINITNTKTAVSILQRFTSVDITPSFNFEQLDESILKYAAKKNVVLKIPEGIMEKTLPPPPPGLSLIDKKETPSTKK